MGPATFGITERVSAFEKPRLIAWQKEFGARWLLLAVREQHLEPAGQTSCSYHNTDRFGLTPFQWTVEGCGHQH